MASADRFYTAPEGPQAQPDGSIPGNAQSRIGSGPSMFGGLVGQGVEKAGQGATQAFDFFGQVAADQGKNNYFYDSNAIKFGTGNKREDGSIDAGYLGTTGQSALDGYEAAKKNIDDSFQYHRSTVPGAFQENYDQARRQYEYDLATIGRHRDEQMKTWATTQNASTSSQATYAVSRAPYDDANFDNQLHFVRDAAVKDAQLKYGVNPAMPTPAGATAVQATMRGAEAQLVVSRIEAVRATDAAAASKWMEKYKDILSAPIREGMPGTWYDKVSEELKHYSEQQGDEAYKAKVYGNAAGGGAPQPKIANASTPSPSEKETMEKNQAANVNYRWVQGERAQPENAEFPGMPKGWKPAGSANAVDATPPEQRKYPASPDWMQGITVAPTSTGGVQGANSLLEPVKHGLQDIVHNFGPITLNSTTAGEHMPGSFHYNGLAADVSIAGMNDQQLTKLIDTARMAGFTGFGLGATHLHIDMRPSGGRAIVFPDHDPGEGPVAGQSIAAWNQRLNFEGGQAPGSAVYGTKPVGNVGGYGAALNRTLLEEGSALVRDVNGAWVKWGINKAANPDVDVQNLTREQAAEIYKKRYWEPLGLDFLAKSNPGFAHVAFDTAVVHGVEQARKWMEQSDGNPAILLTLREQNERALVGQNPGKYGGAANAWHNRVAHLRADLGLPGGAPGEIPYSGMGTLQENGFQPVYSQAAPSPEAVPVPPAVQPVQPTPPAPAQPTPSGPAPVAPSSTPAPVQQAVFAVPSPAVPAPSQADYQASRPPGTQPAIMAPGAAQQQSAWDIERDKISAAIRMTMQDPTLDDKTKRRRVGQMQADFRDAAISAEQDTQTRQRHSNEALTGVLTQALGGDFAGANRNLGEALRRGMIDEPAYERGAAMLDREAMRADTGGYGFGPMFNDIESRMSLPAGNEKRLTNVSDLIAARNAGMLTKAGFSQALQDWGLLQGQQKREEDLPRVHTSMTSILEGFKREFAGQLDNLAPGMPLTRKNQKGLEIYQKDFVPRMWKELSAIERDPKKSPEDVWKFIDDKKHMQEVMDSLYPPVQRMRDEGVIDSPQDAEKAKAIDAAWKPGPVPRGIDADAWGRVILNPPTPKDAAYPYLEPVWEKAVKRLIEKPELVKDFTEKYGVDGAKILSDFRLTKAVPTSEGAGQPDQAAPAPEGQQEAVPAVRHSVSDIARWLDENIEVDHKHPSQFDYGKMQRMGDLAKGDYEGAAAIERSLVGALERVRTKLHELGPEGRARHDAGSVK